MISNLHEAVGEMLKVKMFEDETENVPAVQEKPKVTPELVAEISEEVPELKELDQEQLQKGMEVEAEEHYDSVGGDMAIIAKITKDHLLEFPGKDYYGALDQLETQLKGEEIAGEQTEEAPVEEPEVTTEEPKVEATAESKVTEETVQQGKEDVAAQQAKSDKEAEKTRSANAALKATETR